MEIFKDLVGFLTTLSLVDLIFFFSMVILIILVVSLIYFIRINDEVFKIDKQEQKIEKEDNKGVPEMAYDEAEERELPNLETITKALEENKDNIDLNVYEEEQEQKAIISYDELLAKKDIGNINYTKEEKIDDLTVKQVDLKNIVDTINKPETNLEVRVISYAKEEAFLEALKKLQQKLN